MNSVSDQDSMRCGEESPMKTLVVNDISADGAMVELERCEFCFVLRAASRT